MTIIAYKSGVLASDSAGTSNGTFDGGCTKIVRNKKGDLAGAAGEAVYHAAFIEWFLKGEKGPSPDATKHGDPANSSKGLIVRRNAVIEVYEWTGKYFVKAEYYAMGSGRDHAFGAMYAGASVEEYEYEFDKQQVQISFFGFSSASTTGTW